MKQQLKSRTNRFAIFMAMLEGIAGALTVLQPILTIEQFAITSAVIAFTTSMGMVFFRNITTMAISDK